ncbi:hypothetical protein Mapa_006001 [Marchantia paleacea]|nr:hypothetical protein Mapa_006001 [Marchantia paleacea]
MKFERSPDHCISERENEVCIFEVEDQSWNFEYLILDICCIVADLQPDLIVNVQTRVKVADRRHIRVGNQLVNCGRQSGVEDARIENHAAKSILIDCKSRSRDVELRPSHCDVLQTDVIIRGSAGTSCMEHRSVNDSIYISVLSRRDCTVSKEQKTSLLWISVPFEQAVGEFVHVVQSWGDLRRERNGPATEADEPVDFLGSAGVIVSAPELEVGHEFGSAVRARESDSVEGEISLRGGLV